MKWVAALLIFCSVSLRAATGDVTGAAVEPRGHFLKLYIAGYGQGTNNPVLGIATNGWITETNSITFRVNSPSKMDDGVTTNNTAWTNVVTWPRRADYPQQSNIFVQIVGQDAVVWLAMARSIHAGDWIDWAQIRANTYSNNAAAILTLVTNEATIPHPRPIFKWADIPHQLSGENQTLYMEPYQASAQLGRQVRAIQFWGVDSAGNNTGTNTVTAPSSYNLWSTTLSYTNLTQGLTVSNHATVIPWAGNPWSTADGAKPPDHHDYGPFITYNNKNGTWPVAIACVDPDSVSTGVAVTNWSLTTNGTMVPFADFRVAMQALGSTNNQFNSISSYENTFLLITNKDQGTRFGSTSGSLTARTASTRPWTTVMAWPHLNRSNVILYVTASTDSQTLNQKLIKMKLQNVFVSWTNNAAFSAQGYGHNWFDNCLISSNGANASAFLCNSFTNLYITRSDFLGQRANLTTQPNQVNCNVTMISNTFWRFSDGNSTTISPSYGFRNRFVPATRSQYQYRNDGSGGTLIDTFIWSYSEHYNHDDIAYLYGVGLNSGLTNGGAIAMCVSEGVVVNNGFGPDIMFSQRDNEAMTNLMMLHLTVGNVTHPPFDYGYTNVTRQDFVNVNNLYADYEFQGGASNSTNRGTNTAVVLYSIDASGNAMFEVNNTPKTPGIHVSGTLANFEYGFNGINSGYWPTNQNRIGFVDNRGYSSTFTNAFGNYRLMPSSWAIESSPNWRRVLTYDLDNRLIPDGGWPGSFAAPRYVTRIAGSGTTAISGSGTTSANAP